MPTFIPSDKMVASVLADEVYHTAGQAVNVSSLGWVPVTDPTTGQPMYEYDVNSGYYGEVWGKPNGSGGYSEIMQVSRGTVVSSPGANTFNANADLTQHITSDTTNTLEDDVQIAGANALGLTNLGISGTPDDYMASAQSLYDRVVSAYGTSTPLIEDGQSLGGFTAQRLVANNIGSNPNLTGMTDNALPYTPEAASADGVSDADLALAQQAIQDNYVTNESVFKVV